jgi:hypothetical protein
MAMPTSPIIETEISDHAPVVNSNTPSRRSRIPGNTASTAAPAPST